MLAYALKRVVGLVPTLLGVTLVVFLLIHLAPGGPIAMLLGSQATPEEIARAEASLGLDRPLPEQYLIYLSRILQGDFGASIQTGRPVLDSFMQRLPYTLQFVILSIVLSAAGAFIVGLVAGIRNRSLFDSATMIGILFAVSMPNFWLALMLILVFAVRFPILPLYGMPLISEDFFGGLAASLLPAIALGANYTAMLSRTIRGEMIEVLSQGYIRLAKGFGLPGWKIYMKYALKNALIPVITMLGLQVRYAFGGAAIIEVVFAIPGISQYLVNGILARDYPVIQGTILLLALIFAVVNLLVDLAYGYFDPRVKL